MSSLGSRPWYTQVPTTALVALAWAIARLRDTSGAVPSSSQIRKRSKLHAVAQPNSGRNSQRSTCSPIVPHRGR